MRSGPRSMKNQRNLKKRSLFAPYSNRPAHSVAINRPRKKHASSGTKRQRATKEPKNNPIEVEGGKTMDEKETWKGLNPLGGARSGTGGNSLGGLESKRKIFRGGENAGHGRKVFFKKKPRKHPYERRCFGSSLKRQV